MTNKLINIKTFDQLIRYLEEELDWPCKEYGFEDLTFQYTPQELGIKDEDSVQIKQIHQLRPFFQGQPWGIFFIEFEKKRLPVALLRRVLSHLVIKKRTSANKAEKAVWSTDNLLFISAFGDETAEQREIAFAHFSQESGDLPTLKVLGWDGADTVLKMEFVDQQLHEKLCWPKNPKDAEAWKSQWSSAFRHKPGHVIRTADALADRLAELARGIRAAAETLMTHESEHGHLRKLHKAFQTALIHDLTETDFADTYAQTITYGLLTAAISRTDMSAGASGTALVAGNITDMVPITNPFLKEMLETFISAGDHKGGIQFDELGIQDVVDLLRGEETDLPAILRDFNNRAPGEDPVIHFYEHFLSSYNKKLKVQRGVFYTPKPVVSYIVRSVHELLKTEFGLEDGLADTTTWEEMEKKIPGLMRPETADPESPFVMILDPATGTATFLVEVIDVIFKTLTDKWEKQHLNKTAQIEAWNEYVPLHLLPRLFGFELMMAPYAIAHMKVGLKLFETGYKFGSDERVRIFLSNALEIESIGDMQQTFAELAPALAHEALSVSHVKKNVNFTVVIGNPPYSYMSANLSSKLREIVDIYRKVDGEVIHEHGAIMLERTLQDDYIKFHAFADLLTKKYPAIRAFITNSGFLDGPTLRGMRCYLVQNWDSIWLFDLHGDLKRSDGDDTNVFDIRTGVAISIFIRSLAKPNKLPNISFAEIIGTREEKYSFLGSNSLLKTNFHTINPQTPYYLFRPQSLEGQSDLAKSPSIHDVFILKSEAIKTNRDNFVIGFSDDEIIRRINIFTNPSISTTEIKEKLSINDNAAWSVDLAREECRKSFSLAHLSNIAYRPFDNRRIYYHSSVVFSPRPVLAENVLGRSNLVFLTSRRIRTGNHAHFFVTNQIAVKEMLSSADNCNAYPIYRYKKLFFQEEKLPNLTPEFLSSLANHLGVKQTNNYGLPEGLTVEDIFYYIYAIFYSPTYRQRYAEWLRIDFPRLPIVSNIELLRDLSSFGEKLVSLHLLEATILEKPITSFYGIGDRTIQNGFPKFSNNDIQINSSQGINGITRDVWEFNIGNYQVCEKWLKDRRGRQLSEEDIIHYQKIIVAIKETIRIMGEIDEVIELHGGWPIK